MTESTPTLTPERAAAIMRLWLPEGPFPGAPSTGPALLARSRQESGPTAHIVAGPGRGSSRYVESEVIEYCRCLWPSRIRKALACLGSLEKRSWADVTQAFGIAVPAGKDPWTSDALAQLLATEDEP